MRIVYTKHLEDGMKLAKPVYSANGEVLLNNDVELTSGYIKNLQNKNIPAVYIEDSLSEGIEIEDVIDPIVKVKAVDTVKNIVDSLDPKKNKNMFVSSESYFNVRKLICQIMDNLQKNEDSLFNMVETLSTDLATYTHLVNVAILALLTGRALGLPEKQIADLGTGALMHDIGIVNIPHGILNKAGKLTDEEYKMIKKHPVHGYDMVKSNQSISAIAKMIILMHHERLDGSGYPLGITGEKIHKCIRIVSICDAFEAMVSDRVYREKMPIYKALEMLTSMTTTQLDLEIYKKFVENIAIYTPGAGVILSTGEKGIVVENNRSFPTRPKIRILFGPDGTFNPGAKIVNLMEDLTLFIEDTCHIQY
ncbi:HD-GYP domain, c-di-GMP phosphodiesterase class II (or its inactivated variant) [Peptoclostridium litorale DSM 5388]|uniref:Metal dependent phosphohydrolase n=1 Tax=Peptoclostridium litorale DSM 5388 TaxID=1121324 RepID=A0A069REB2_PEPLI|nr:HD-GYP domain-containing protein [Peptoclostridium litorale]KDR95414.1 metal dependent phosphohydrolase [Peptoclostridium litorale DSM 5388]SIO19236.1 HD-GYP domain, c-di-GMP phosphodiesterase class II (or its inactivated variant) [Peptoclostridium litorale DSM 5388]